MTPHLAAAVEAGRGAVTENASQISMQIEASRARVLSAARAACKQFRVDQSWAEDLAQEVAIMQLRGERVRLDRRGMNWLLSGLLRGMLHLRVKPETAAAFVRQHTPPPSDPVIFAELQQIYRLATPAQQGAIRSLMLDGQNTSGGALSREEQQRRGQALYSLRKKLNAGDAE